MVADVVGRPKRMPVGERRSGDGGEEGGDGDRPDRRRRGRGRRGRGEGGPRGEEDEGAREGGIKVSCCSVFGSPQKRLICLVKTSCSLSSDSSGG